VLDRRRVEWGVGRGDRGRAHWVFGSGWVHRREETGRGVSITG
jgi:hypothetical protein